MLRGLPHQDVGQVQVVLLPGQTEAVQGRRDARVRAAGGGAAALPPTYAKPHYIAGAALLALRRPAEAASALRRALRHDDDGRCAREIDATLLDGLVLCLDTYPARTPPAPARRLVDARA